MFSDCSKKLGLLICAAALSSCGFFSDDKDLPAGTRVSVLAANPHRAEALAAEIKSSALPKAQNNAEWAQTGGNSYHVMNNISARSNMKPSWTAAFGEGSSKRNLLTASPVIAGGKIFAQDAEGTVSAFNLSDGKRLWKQKLKPLRKYENDSGLNGSGLAAAGNTIYAAAGFGSVFALNAKDGKVLWRKDINTPLRTAPAVCSGKLLVQTLDNRLFALKTDDGSEIWKYNISAEDTVLAGGAVPACQMAKNLVVAGFSNGEIQAFNADIGYPLWSTTIIDGSQINSAADINAIKAAPVIDGDTVFAVGHNNLTAAVDYRTGEKIWEQDIGGTNMPWIAGKYLFVLSNDNTLSALDKTNGRILWTSRFLEEFEPEDRSGVYLSGPVMINSQLLVTASNGIVYAVSPQNGKTIHRLDLGDPLPHAPVAAAGTVVFTTDDAELVVYK